MRMPEVCASIEEQFKANVGDKLTTRTLTECLVRTSLLVRHCCLLA
jgi:hypothetical protein